MFCQIQHYCSIQSYLQGLKIIIKKILLGLSKTDVTNKNLSQKKKKKNLIAFLKSATCWKSTELKNVATFTSGNS